MATTPLTDEITRNDYTATAGQTSFPYTFWIRDEDDLLVYVNGTLKTKTTDYTVSAVQSVTGANVVFTSGLTLNDAVAIVYEPSIERETGYTTGGSFRANSFNLDITYGLSLSQYLKTELSRTVKVDNTESGSAPTISGSLTAGELVQVNSGGTSIVSSGLDGDDLSALVAISADISTVAGISANVTTVAGDSADISTVATNIANVNTTASNISNVNTVASNSANVTLVATDIANVNTVATNITGVNSFAERYRVVSSDPVSDNDEGDLIYNSTDNLLKYYNGTSFISLSSGLVNVVEDTTPQLGGDLDLNGNSITSPDGTDSVSIPNGSVDISTNSSSRVDITDSGVRLGGSGARVTTILDEDTMSSNSATALATQQSIKAYVESFIDKTLYVEENQPNGTNGGSNTGGSYVQRVLNTVVRNNIAGSSLSSNNITLPAGKYEILVRAPGHYYIFGHRARLEKTDGTVLLRGQNAHAGWLGGSSTANTICTTNAIVEGTIELTEETSLRVMHYTESTYASKGFGVAISDTGVEIYTTVKIKKIS